MKITQCEAAVLALKDLKIFQPAECVAGMLGTSTRSVSSALRYAVADGRVDIRMVKGRALYRFVRVSKKPRESLKKATDAS